MIDEFDKCENEENANYNGGDPKVPVFLRSFRTTMNKSAAKVKAYYPTRCVQQALTYVWMGICWVWRKVLTNAAFWTALATVVIAFATIYYTRYAKKQWQAMDKQLRDFEASQRAVLAPDGTWDKDKGEIVWTLRNIGHSAALEMIAQFGGGSGPINRPAKARAYPVPPPIEALQSIKPLCYGRSETIIPDGKDWPWTESGIQIDPDAAKGNGYFFRYMNFAYVDIFGTRHYGYLCLVNNFRGGYFRWNLSDFDPSKCQ